MLQWKFVLETTDFLHEQGIHVAMETCGFADFKIYQSVVSSVDLIIMDIKHLDSEKHKQGTGQKNEKILENFQYLCESKKPCIIRTPLIPGFNDEPKLLQEIEELARKAPGLMKYEYMPYHALGTGKLESLGIK